MQIKCAPKRNSFYAWMLFYLVGFFLFYEMNIEVSASVTSQDIMADFGIGAKEFGTSMMFYFCSLAGVQLIVGYLFDRYPLKRLLLISVGAMTVSLLLLSQVHALWQMSLLRFTLGFGASFAWVSMLVVGIRWFSPEGYDFKVGMAQCCSALGGMIGGTVVAYLLTILDWRQTFLCFAGAGAVLWCCMALFVISEPDDNDEEKQSLEKHAILPVSTVLKKAYFSKAAWLISIYTFCSYAPITGFLEVWGSPYFMQYYSKSAESVSYLFYAFWIGLAVSAFFVGWLASYLQKRVLLMGICAGVGAICFSVIIWGPHLSEIMMMCMLAGIGVSVSGQVLSFPLAHAWHDDNILATVIGLINFCGMVTGVLMSYLIGRGLDFYGPMVVKEGVPIYSLEAYNANIWIFPVLCLIGVLLTCFALREKRV